jgi:hypothetical protein
MAISNFVPELWSAAVQAPFEKSLVFAQPSVANRKYEGEIKQMGDAVNVTSITTPTIRAYDKGTDLTIEDVADSTDKLVIDQGDYFAFRVNDVDKVQAAGDFEGPALKQAAYGLRDKVDQYIAGLFNESQSTGGPIAGNRLGNVDVFDGEPGGAVGGLASAYQVLVKLREKLDKNSVPLEGRYAVVHPEFISALSYDTRFTDQSASGSGETLRNGFVSRVQGFDILVSNNLVTGSGRTLIVAGVPDALSFANQIAETEALRAQDRFADIVRGLNIYGAKIFRRNGVASANVALVTDES